VDAVDGWWLSFEEGFEFFLKRSGVLESLDFYFDGWFVSVGLAGGGRNLVLERDKGGVMMMMKFLSMKYGILWRGFEVSDI